VEENLVANPRGNSLTESSDIEELKHSPLKEICTVDLLRRRCGLATEILQH